MHSLLMNNHNPVVVGLVRAKLTSKAWLDTTLEIHMTLQTGFQLVKSMTLRALKLSVI